MICAGAENLMSDDEPDTGAEPGPAAATGGGRARDRRRIIAGSSAVVLVILAVVLIAVALRGQQTPPKPSAADNPPSSSQSATNPGTPTATPTTAPTTTPGTTRGSTSSSGRATTSRPAPSGSFTLPRGNQTLPPLQITKGPILPAATPTSIDIPAIDVRSTLVDLGQLPDSSIQVPPLEQDSKAGWYHNSPPPGTVGPSIILGHIDSAKYGPGIFFKLGALHIGDTVSVSRSDGTVAVFRIERVAEFPKNHFPTKEVFGNLDHAGLRLITCGGKFDASVHSYEDNIVAFGSLVSSHR